MSVANGRKMIPRSGKIHVSNAALTSAGRATQMMNRPSLGKIPAKSAEGTKVAAFGRPHRRDGDAGGR
jgi:hypothetical protein